MQLAPPSTYPSFARHSNCHPPREQPPADARLATITTFQAAPGCIMYEAILGHLDALALALGLSRDGQEIRRGVNPWGYAGGGYVPQEKEGKAGEEIEIEQQHQHEKGSGSIEIESIRSRSAAPPVPGAELGVTRP